MNRYFVDKIENQIVLDGDEFRHFCVLREKVGDKIIVCTNDLFDYFFRVEKIEKSRAVCSFLYKEQNKQNSSADITVFFGLLKGDNSALVVQKLSELGVRYAIPFESEFTVAKGSTNKTQRLEKVAIESAKQCRRSFYMQVSETIRFEDIFKYEFDCKIFAYENATENLKSEHFQNAKRIALIVGSEGGFSESEVSQAKSNGYDVISLGSRILRAETASITLVSIANFIVENQN